MIKNYFKTAWRNILKNKFYAAINISGLAVGLAVGILILLWVQHEFSYDSFHKNAKRIYKVENMVGTGSSRQLWTNTAAPIGILAQKQIPGIEAVTRLAAEETYRLFRYQEKRFEHQQNYYTDPSFFSVFDFPLITGNKLVPFPTDGSVVITTSTAIKYFGTNDPMGKVITADDKMNFTVSGVINDFPKNSTIKADMLFPINLLAKNMYAGNSEGKNLENDFNQFSYNTFLLMKPGSSFSGFTSRLRQIHLGVKADDTDVEYLLLPLEKMHLFRSDGSDGGYASVRMFIVIAILILLIACINYVNLSTARSMLRVKEVSLRKIVGAGRAQLFMQFIVETILLFSFATASALLLIYLLLPAFNTISGKELILDFRDYQLWTIILITITGTLFLSGIYPALLLSSFEPLKALKGKIAARISDTIFRKVLVVVQFSFSMILISGTIVIAHQLSYMRSKQLGYDKSYVFTVTLPQAASYFDIMKSNLLQQPGISNITRASVNIVRYGGQTGDNSWYGKQAGETMMVSPMAIDRNFLSFFKMKLTTGTGFSGTGADSTHFILNETAVKAARLTNPIGKKFKLWKTEGTIIGVAKDFHFSSMRARIEPAVFYYTPNIAGLLYVKTTGKEAPKAIAAVKKEWEKYNAGTIFSYTFLDDSFNDLYKSEERTGLLFNLFAGIAILISCLGLLGLAAYTAQVRTREIGVRKVLGAGVPAIIRLLATDFMKLVLIAIVIASPVAWYLMSRWLNDFAYKINMSWTILMSAGLLAMLIALATISVQSVKAAMANPMKSLRME